MRFELFQGDVKKLEPIVAEWYYESLELHKRYGFEIDKGRWWEQFDDMANNHHGFLIVGYNDSIPVGFMGVLLKNSYCGKEYIADEHYWYVSPKHRGISSVRFIPFLETVAKTAGCSHVMLNANCMAGGRTENIWKLYERQGYLPYDKSYLKGIK